MQKILVFLAVFTLSTLGATAADATIPNRMREAKVGEWVMMVNVSGEEAGERIKVSLIEKNGDVVVIQRERFNADGSAGETDRDELQLSRYSERLADLENRAKQISRERLTVKDQELSVVAVTWDREIDGETHEFKVWVAEELPLGGIAKTWSSDPGFPAADVVDYGFY